MSTQETKPFMITDHTSGEELEKAGFYKPAEDLVGIPDRIDKPTVITWKDIHALDLPGDFDVIDQLVAYRRLRAIEVPDRDMIWYKQSFDAGDPECKCSACRLPIRSAESFDNPEGEEAEDHVPMRMWRGPDTAMEEATMHRSCATYLIRNKKFLQSGTHNTVDQPIKLK